MSTQYVVPRKAPVFTDETHTQLVRRARKMHKVLTETYPDAHCELDFTTPLELLVATILSAQTTDVMVNKVTPTLFAKYPDAKAYAEADREEMETLLKPTGFFRAKTNSLLKLGQALVDDYDGVVPGKLEELVKLPGTGRKTANVVLGNAFGVPGITVDTHFDAAGSPVRLDHRGGPGQGRAHHRGAVPEEGLDHVVAPADLPRPPPLPRQEARLRRLPDRPVVPVLRHRAD